MMDEHIIGKTESGKVILALAGSYSFFVDYHKDWTVKDHLDAFKLLTKKGYYTSAAHLHVAKKKVMLLPIRRQIGFKVFFPYLKCHVLTPHLVI